MGGYMGKEIKGYINVDELKRLIATNSISVQLRDVVDLPPELIIEKLVTLTDDTRARYKRLQKELLLGVREGENERSVSNVLEKLMRLSQVTSGLVMDELDQLHDASSEKLTVLEDTIGQIDGKVAVFCRYTRSIDRIADMCKRAGWSYMIYDGRESDGTLPMQYNESDTKVWIAQLSKGIGYSIPKAKYVVFYELDYSRVNHNQCKGRNLRAVGSEDGSCCYIYLLCPETIDPTVYKVLKDKDFTAADAMEYVRGVDK